ncbi:MAG: right-handed parallel beta-helix repeat-containing protein [Candidatus Bathyarchaeota archaeon]|nr:right-handed parallel beta-helix repeat-containing protein [Candidatus Bathyarchaeota archaeon]
MEKVYVSLSKVLPIKQKQSSKLLVAALIVLLSTSAVLVFSNNSVSASSIIQDMIDLASDGDTISVPTGTYYGNIVVNKPLTLIGEDKENTIIEGEGSGHTIEVTANGVTISGFTVTNGGAAYPESGIFLNNVWDAVISDNIVQDNLGFGIFVMWGSNNKISNNVIMNCQTGIRVDGHDAPAVIEGNTIRFCDAGIFVYEARNVEVRDNSLVRNPISVEGNSRSINVKNNQISSTTEYGIQFYSSFDSVIESNTISVGEGDGIIVRGQSAFLTIKENEIYDNYIVTAAIALQDGSSNNDVVSNVITGNSGNDVGIIIENSGSLYNRITDNEISSHSTGIYLDQTCYAMVRGNDITVISAGGYRPTGIHGVGCQNTGILENGIQAEYGIYFEASSAISVVENILSACGVKGVYFDYCQNSWIAQNDIADGGIGIHVSGPEGSPAENNIIGNQLTNNEQAMILENTQTNTILGNNFADNSAGGALKLLAASSNTITQNNFSGDPFYISVSEDSASNNFDGNYWADFVAPAPYVIDFTQNIVDNSPLEYPAVYLPVHNTDTGANYATIQEAIDEASDGDLIEVDDGVYYEAVSIWKNVQLIGSSPVGSLVDGGGNVVFGTSTGTSDIVIQNFAITNGAEGIFLQSTSYAYVENNFIYSNKCPGIFEDQGSQNIISNNIVVNNQQTAVHISGSTDSLVSDNAIVYNRDHGMRLIDVVDSTVTGNAFEYNLFNGLGTELDCANLFITSNNMTRNWVNGLDMAHTTNSLVEYNNFTANGQDGAALFECSYVVLENNLAQLNGGIGIYIPASEDITVNANSITQSDMGLQIEGGRHNTATENEISDNNNGGLLVQSSSDNYIAFNTLTGNHGDNLQLSSNANNNQILNNIIQSSGAEGIRLIQSSIYNVVANNTVSGSGGDGIGIETFSNYNDILNNYVVNSGWYGIHPHGGVDDDNRLTGLNIIGNTVENSEIGIILTNAWHCQVYHNNLINNRVVQAASTDTSSDNLWDDGYPSGGNYWSDYTGEDRYYTVTQSVLGSDGIGDVPYTIDPANVDNYPLVNFFNPTTLTAFNYPSGQPLPVTVTSNVTITDVTSNLGTLNFTASGPSGELGYIRFILPIDANNTNLQLFIDNTPIEASSITIEKNSTHYFIYATFTLSSHEIGLLFAVPEYAYAGLVALIACFAAFGVYQQKTKIKIPKINKN